VIDGCVPWPDDIAQQYREAGWWIQERLGDLPVEWARRRPEKVALVSDREQVTYRELADRVCAVATRLDAAGLRSGDRIVVQLPNEPEFVYLVLAAFREGVLPVFALPAHREHEITHLIEHVQARGYAIAAGHRGFDYLALAERVQARSPHLQHLLVMGGDGLPHLSLDPPYDAGDAGAAADVAPESVALFLLSGGTTGLPKLIPRMHAEYVYNFRASAALCGFDERTRYLVVLPIGHNFPFGCPGFLGALDSGGTVIFASSPSPEIAFPLIEATRPTVTAVVPAIALRWLDSELRAHHDLSSVELLQVGGAKLPSEAARRIIGELGCRLQQVFGMAEGLLNFTRLEDPEKVVIETQGRPLSPGDEIRIVDPDEQDVPPGERGELLARGPYTLRGYYEAEEHNRRAFTRDGFYRTGDIVRLHESGNLVVEGRAKDLINRGGEKISAEELEGLILGHAAVRETAVVAMPDPVLGEAVCAFVALHPGRTLQLSELVAFLDAQGIARFKLPARLQLIDHLPLTNVGKVSKAALREEIAQRLEMENQAAATIADRPA
jgi:2,3-dihydroxybenzoate-AMP ligase